MLANTNQLIFALISSASLSSAYTLLSGTIEDDFTSSISDNPNYSAYQTPDKVSTSAEDGLTLTYSARYDNPSIVSKYYLNFGRVEAHLQVAPGLGIVSTLYLQSDDKDEIDLEWLGGDTTQAQSNFFSKGYTGTYNRGAFHSVSNPQSSFHNYTIDWRSDRLEWYIDSVLVRTLLSDNPQGYPQSPSRLFIGVWNGGDPSNPIGTIEWATGSSTPVTDYTTERSMYVKYLEVTEYGPSDSDSSTSGTTTSGTSSSVSSTSTIKSSTSTSAKSSSSTSTAKSSSSVSTENSSTSTTKSSSTSTTKSSSSASTNEESLSSSTESSSFFSAESSSVISTTEGSSSTAAVESSSLDSTTKESVGGSSSSFATSTTSFSLPSETAGVAETATNNSANSKFELNGFFSIITVICLSVYYSF